MKFFTQLKNALLDKITDSTAESQDAEGRIVYDLNDGKVKVGKDSTDTTTANFNELVQRESLATEPVLAEEGGTGQTLTDLNAGADGDVLRLDKSGPTPVWQIVSLPSGGGGGGGSAIIVEDEGVQLTTEATKFNFKGAGVEATQPSPDEIDITIDGGTSLEVEDEGLSLSLTATKMNFKGEGVTATAVGDEITIDIPNVATQLIAGLSVKEEGYYDTAVDGVLNAGNTTIPLGFTVSESDIGMVFVDGEFACPDITLAVTHSWRLVDNDNIELFGDLTLASQKVYVVFFEGNSFTDEQGNICSVLRPRIDSIILQAPDTTLYEVGVQSNGQVTTEIVLTGAPDPLRIKRDDGTTVELAVSNAGILEIENPPLTPGILFDEVWLQANTGLAWKLQVDDFDTIYTTDNDGNKWCLKDQLNNNLFQMKQTEGGVMFHAKMWDQLADVPNPPEILSDSVPYTWVIENGIPTMYMYDVGTASWNRFYSEGQVVDTFPIGHIAHSFLTLAQFKSEMNDVATDRWRLCDGSSLPVGCDLTLLNGWTTLPNAKGSFIRGENTDGAGGSKDPDVLTRTLHEGGVLGSFQDHAMERHRHWISNDSFDSTGGVGGLPRMPNRSGGFNGTDWYTGNGTILNDSTFTDETRPTNINANFFVKINR